MRDPLDLPLPARYERFITEYLKHQNASAAARRAGYSIKSCARQGSRLLRRPEICARLRTELQGLMAQSRASARDLMEERRKAPPVLDMERLELVPIEARAEAPPPHPPPEAQPQLCSPEPPAPEMSGGKPEKHGHLWTSAGQRQNPC